MNRYRIMNRITREWWEGEADSAQEACQKAGWIIGDCYIRQFVKSGKPSASGQPCSGGWGKVREEVLHDNR